MVEDRITDGRRIGQLLASELTLDTGPLGSVSVGDADPDATPTAGGTDAFAIDFEGERVGRVSLFPEAVAVELHGAAIDPERVRARATDRGLAVSDTDEGVVLRVESGAAVKRAVDALAAGLERGD